MALYKKEKFNPLGGCLPLLAQLPIFIALYRLFYSSIEIRHAHFFLWLDDLSANDPYFITPILMAVLMVFQQKLTPMPSTGQNTEAVRIQKMMMKWMPIMFGFFMLFFPSGLVLYFLVNAVFSIIQQLLINKRLDRIMPKPDPVPAQAANGN